MAKTGKHSQEERDSEYAQVIYNLEDLYYKILVIHRDRKQNSRFQDLREGSRGELVFNEYKVLMWDDENVLEVHSGDGCTTM